MHIRTNVEMSFIHVVVLAICPLLFVMTTANEALYYMAVTAICFFASAFVCFVFNKYLSRSIKIFIVAILSSFLVTVINAVIEKYVPLGLKVPDNSVFAMLSAMVLSADIVYINTKALGNNFVKTLRSVFTYAVLLMIYATVKEFLTYGTIFDKKLFVFSGYEFFETMIFNLIWLGLICFIAESINRYVAQKAKEKQITYQKFIKKIRNEKIFQYDNLRRKRLLDSEIETNKIDGDKVEEIKEKESENEVVDVEELSVEEEPSTKSKPKKKKKKSKLKVSKEAKDEQAIIQQTKEED